MGSRGVPVHKFISKAERKEHDDDDNRVSCREGFMRFASNFHAIYFPIFQWLPRYDWRNQLFWDLNAGLVVGILLIPQGMAYALLANQSPVQGLYCAIIPNVVYAMMGTSRESAVGAMALVSIMVGNSVLQLASNPKLLSSRQDVAIKLAFLTGIMQVVLGWLRLGSVATYVSHPVMVGFCTAGEILIAVSQLKYLLGIKVPQFEYAFQTVWYILTHIQQTQPFVLLMGGITFIILFAISKWKKRMRALAEKDPEIAANKRLRALRVLSNFGPFVAIVITAFFAYGMKTKWGLTKVDVIGKVPQGFQLTNPLQFTMDELRTLAPPSFILAVISYMLSFSVAKKYAQAHRYEIDNSQELAAQGAATAVGSFFGAFPVAGGFARTAVNVEAGAQSQISSLVAAGLVAMAVNFLTNTFYFIPMCSLAAIVQVAICGVIDFSNFTKAYRTSKIEFFVMFATFVVTLILGIDRGILVGVAISVVVLIRHTAKPRVRVLGRLPGANVFRDIDRYPQAKQFPGIRVVRVDESFNFASCSSIKEQLLKYAQPWNEKEPPPLHMVIDCCGMNAIDMSGAKILEEIRETLALKGQKLYLANVKAKMRDRLKRQGLFNKFGGDLLYLSLPALLATLVDEEDQGLLRGDQDFNRLMNPEDDVEEDEDYKLRRSMFEIDEHF